jgi:glutathione S-transferase
MNSENAALNLFAHPFSSYSQKVLIALYENGTPFEYRMLSPEYPAVLAEFEQRWPFKRMPILVDGTQTVSESTVIIEYLDLCHPGPVRLLPPDARAAFEVRMMDRFFDQYVMTPMQKIVTDHLRPAASHDPYGVEDARKMLGTAYRWLNDRLRGREWAAGAEFGLADCAAAPSLFYADWVQPVPAEFTNVREYRQRVLRRPSVARAVDEARPYRKYFPPGAPDRD